GFEWRRLTVFGNPAQEDLDDPLNVCRRFTAVLTYCLQLLSHVRLLGVLADKLRKVPGGIRKQHLKHETHGAGSAFNVGENGFDRHPLSPPGVGSDWRCLRQ